MASTALTQETKAKFIPIIDAILHASDLSTVSVKKVRNGLQSQAGYDITPQKAASPLSTPCYSAPVYLPYIPTPILTAAQKAIDALITLRFDKVLAEKEAEANPPDDTGDDADDDIKAEDASDRTSVKADEEEDDDDDEGTVAYSVKAEDTENGIIAAPKLKRSASSLDEDARLAAELHAQWNGGRPSRHKKKAPKTTPKKRAGKKSEETVNSDVSDSGKAKKKKRKVNPNSPFNAPLILSEPLANFIGEPQLSRPETVKRIWQYVRERGLQDPEDRRYILCDDSMKPVFGNKIHMFTLNKVLSQNMFKPGETV